MFQRIHPKIAAMGAVVLATMVLGCEDDFGKEIDECIESSMLAGRRAFWIQGVWRISGDGERSNCSNSAYNAETLDIRSQPLRVHQQGHFLFLESGQQGRLPGFALSGIVGDRCVRVKTLEETSVGSISYDFPGKFIGSSSFKGEFRGSGPQGCEAKGDFSVFSDLDPLPASATYNPAPGDAGTNQDELCAACRASCQLVDSTYVSECQEGCTDYVCNPDPPDSSVPDTDIPDASDEDAEDAEPDVLEDAPSDATDELDGDDEAGEAGEAGDLDGDTSDAEGGIEDASDEDVGGDGALADGPDDVTEADGGEEGGLEYAIWNGTVTPDDIKEAAEGCGVTAGKSGPRVYHWLLLGLAALGIVARRRRR